MREQEFFRGDVAGLSARDFDGESIKDRTELPDKFPKTGLKENFRKKLRRGAAAAMAIVALSGPMASHAEEAPVPEVTDTAVVVTPEPTAEVKAEVTAAVENPEVKVSIEDAKAIFDNYKQKLFAPFEQELRGLGCIEGSEENWDSRIECGAKWLYAYDNGKDMAGGDSRDKFQNYIARDSIVEYVRTGDVRCIEDDSGSLSIIFNNENKPRMLVVNSTYKITQGITDSMSYLIENGFSNVQELVYNSGLVIYFCSDYGRGYGSFMVSKYGIVCSEMTEENTENKKAKSLMISNASKIPGESYGVLQYQLRDALDLESFGDPIGDVEVCKAIQSGYSYIGLYEATGFEDFLTIGNDLIAQGINTFATQYGISVDDPRIEKQIALAIALATSLDGVDLSRIGDIQRITEEYLVI